LTTYRKKKEVFQRSFKGRDDTGPRINPGKMPNALPLRPDPTLQTEKRKGRMQHLNQHPHLTLQQAGGAVVAAGGELLPQHGLAARTPGAEFWRELRVKIMASGCFWKYKNQ
jgi:hypothetical protein